VSCVFFHTLPFFTLTFVLNEYIGQTHKDLLQLIGLIAFDFDFDLFFVPIGF